MASPSIGLLCHTRARAVLAVALLVAVAGPAARAGTADPPTLVVRWNDVLLECVREAKPGPPMVARAIAVTHTCGFDAWAMYDDVAVATRTPADQRRPPAERTEANREAAFSEAEYRALLDLFPGQRALIRGAMASFGYDPDDSTHDGTAALAVGLRCAEAVTRWRHGDGANQLGDLHPGPYSDYTGYAPVNTPDRIVDPNHWQPLAFCDGHGGFVTPGYVGPQWGSVTPFALAAWNQFPLPGPKQLPQGGYHAQVEHILQLNAQLDDEQKMIAEYWADGPHSELPPGHWMLFGEFVSARDHHSFDDDVKLFFILGNAEMDAGIAVWGAKRQFDSERPITAVHWLMAGRKVQATVPFKGRQLIDGADWTPYQPCTFVTPPFPEYPSGHSAFSAAGAEILKRWSGSDAFGGSVQFAAGAGRVEPGYAPAHDITLSWATFSDAADQAGMSRRYGGIHFEDGDLDSRRLGREVAGVVWDTAQRYIHGDVAVARAGAIARGAARPATPHATLVGVGAGPGARDVTFALDQPGAARLTVLDVQGRIVQRLADGAWDAGLHTVAWSQAPAAGVYFVRLEAGGDVRVRRAIVR